MKYSDVQSALFTHWVNGAFNIETLYPNEDAETTPGKPRAELSLLPVSTSPSTTGPSGRDVHEGILQVMLRYPVNQGNNPALTMADEIAQHYQAGERPAYNGQDVIIRGASISPPMVDGGWLNLAVSVNYTAYFRRSL